MTSPDKISQKFQASLLNSTEYQPDPPEPLGVKLQRISFPIDALGKDLKRYLLALHNLTQVPLEICFAALFSALNHAAQALVSVKLPQGQVKPISCFFIANPT